MGNEVWRALSLIQYPTIRVAREKITGGAACVFAEIGVFKGNQRLIRETMADKGLFTALAGSCNGDKLVSVRQIPQHGCGCSNNHDPKIAFPYKMSIQITYSIEAPKCQDGIPSGRITV
jgi:hypothetical protein